METYLADLTLNETFTIPDEHGSDYSDVANRLAAKLREGNMILDSFVSVEELVESDHHDDGQIPVVCNQTVFEIGLQVEDTVDVYDSAMVMEYIAHALETRNGTFQHLFSAEGEDCERTVVRIIIEGV